jgi:murein DD-endopeptidase MepM/ murein hydrolase activator NlpD
MTMLIAATVFAMRDDLVRTWKFYGKYPPPVAPYTRAGLPTQSAYLPLIFPLIGSYGIKNNYNQNRGAHRHTGIDITARKMTPIVAPFSGVFGNKVHSFWIYGDNGWRCLGTHLNDDTPGTNDGKNNVDFMFAPNLRFGDRVEQGQLIGYVGNSGQATGPHLHFELHGPNGLRNPYQSLAYSQRLREPRLKLQSQDDIPESKQERYEICKRNWTASTGAFYGILVAKQFDTGKVIISTKPRYITMTFPSDLTSAIDPAAWPDDRPASIYFVREGDKVRITKIIPPPHT